MPTYAYECTGCGHAFEAFQKMSDSPLTLCEVCGGALQKRMFPVGIVFKGSGFYVNDYARKGKEGASDSTPAAATSTEKPAASPESAPAAKADTPGPSTTATATKPADTPKAPAS